MLPIIKDLTIYQGKTFLLPIKWETDPLVYKAITGISKTAPCVVTCVGHEVPDGWHVAIISAGGMTQINAKYTPPRDSDYVVATYIDDDTLELNAVSSAGFKAYTSGGYVMYRTPKDLTDYTARMSIKDEVGGTELLSLTTENGRITIDTLTSTVTLLLDAADTAAIDWVSGIYDLELVSPDATEVVKALMSGTVTVVEEVTT